MTIKLGNVSAGYDRHPVVHHISGTFSDNSMTAVIGPNGGGKSTLIKAIAGFVPLMSGAVDYAGLTPHQIAYLPQQFEIDRTFPISVIEVVLLGHWPLLGSLGRVRGRNRDEALQALDQVDMAAFAHRPIISLSTGQWQRVLFARLSLQHAKLILLDEPFAAIDGRTTHDLLHVLETWQHQGSTIISVMHDFSLVRDHFPETLILARDLIGWGATKEVMSDENLARASSRAGEWVEHASICMLNDRSAT
jgi:zinc/manganese transport system ATP-binding protein